MARKGMLPVQAFDEIGVGHDRTKTPQTINITIKQPKEKKRKARKGKK